MQRERTTEGDFPGFRAELLHFRQIIRNRAATFSAARAKRPTSLPTAVKLNPREIRPSTASTLPDNEPADFPAARMRLAPSKTTEVCRQVAGADEQGIHAFDGRDCFD